MIKMILISSIGSAASVCGPAFQPASAAASSLRRGMSERPDRPPATTPSAVDNAELASLARLIRVELSQLDDAGVLRLWYVIKSGLDGRS